MTDSNLVLVIPLLNSCAVVLSSKGEDFLPITLGNIDKKLLQLEQKTPWHSVLQIFRPMQPIWKYHSQISNRNSLFVLMFLVSSSNIGTIINGAVGCLLPPYNTIKINTYETPAQTLTFVANNIDVNAMIPSLWPYLQILIIRLAQYQR